MKGMDMLDMEAEEDEVFQEEASGSRLPSSEANKELVSKAERYRQILGDAAQSDELVRAKWETWEQNIIELTWDEVTVSALLPRQIDTQ